MQIYIATTNPSKLKNFESIFATIDDSIEVLSIPEKIEVEENGKTIAENSKLKVLPYRGLYDKPVITNDFGLEFGANLDLDPSTVKRNALNGYDETSLSQEEIARKMLDFYKKIVKEEGGAVKCSAIDVFSILDPNGVIHQETSYREYVMLNREVKKFDIYHPLNSIRKSEKIGKFMDEFSEEDKKEDFKPVIEAISRLITNI